MTSASLQFSGNSAQKDRLPSCRVSPPIHQYRCTLLGVGVMGRRVWKNCPELAQSRPAVEPATSWLQGWHPTHCTTKPPRKRVQTFNSGLGECPMFHVKVTCVDSSIVNGLTLSVSHQLEKDFQHRDGTWCLSEPTKQDVWNRWVEMRIEVGGDKYETNVCHLKPFMQ